MCKQQQQAILNNKPIILHSGGGIIFVISQISSTLHSSHPSPPSITFRQNANSEHGEDLMRKCSCIGETRTVYMSMTDGAVI